MDLLPLFKWFDETAIANAIRDSRFLFPIIESIHILALTVLLGSVVVVGLRLLGVGLKTMPVSELAGGLAPLRNASLALILLTGVLLFASEALKCYENPPFWAKMKCLAAAILFQYTVVRWATAPNRETGRLQSSVVAILSIALWFGVGIAGRSIGFY
jgi:hypothetical protein